MPCFFATNRSTGCLRSAATDLTSVSCNGDSTKPISEYLPIVPSSINLYGCSAIEILFMRGNGEVPDNVESLGNHMICKPHLDFLLLKWPNNNQQKRGMIKGREIIKCSLPHETPRAVHNRAIIRKDEVAEWLARTGELVHVGSPICSNHRAIIQKAEEKTLVLSSRTNIPPKRNQYQGTDDTDFDLDSMNFRLEEEEEFEALPDKEELSFSSVDASTELRNEISSHFSSIAKLMGSSHYAAKRDWKVLSEDSKRRKTSLVLTMVQLLCSFVAPGSDSELTEAVAEKLSPKKRQDSDNCANQVITAIGERLLEAPNRRSRIETLALIVDLPFFSATKRDYECSTPGCYANFLTLRNLEIHETIGIHKFRSKKQTLLDFAIDSLNAKVETLDVAKAVRANDSFASTTVNGDTGIPMGWALKKPPTGGISDNAHDEAAAYFSAQRSMEPPRRAEPRAFSIMMENMMKPDGDYKFKARELLSEKQLTGLFSRLEKLRVSGVSVARKTRGRKPSKSSRKRAHPVSSDEEMDQIQDDDNQKEEEMEGEMDDEEDLVWDCIKEMHNEIFV